MTSWRKQTKYDPQRGGTRETALCNLNHGWRRHILKVLINAGRETHICIPSDHYGNNAAHYQSEPGASRHLTWSLSQRWRRRRRRSRWRRDTFVLVVCWLALALVHHLLRTDSLELLHPAEHFIFRRQTSLRSRTRHSWRPSVSWIKSSPSTDHMLFCSCTNRLGPSTLRPRVPISLDVSPPLVFIACLTGGLMLCFPCRSGLTWFLADSF